MTTKCSTTPTRPQGPQALPQFKRKKGPGIPSRTNGGSPGPSPVVPPVLSTRDENNINNAHSDPSPTSPLPCSYTRLPGTLITIITDHLRPNKSK